MNEKDKARKLRKSSWWQNKIQQASCYYCQKPLLAEEVTMDHVVPLAKGGRSVRGNVVTACKPCNTAKHSQTRVEWILNDLTKDPDPPADSQS